MSPNPTGKSGHKRFLLAPDVALGFGGAVKELSDRLVDPSFTPGRPHVLALLALAGRSPEEDLRIEKLLSKIQTPYLASVLAAYEGLSGPSQSVLLAALVRGSKEPLLAFDVFVRALRSAEPLHVRLSVRGLGALGDRRALPILTEAFESSTHPHDKKRLAKALALLGSPLGRELLAGDVAGQKAIIKGARDAVRGASESSIAAEVSLRGQAIWLLARAGLEPWVSEEIKARLPGLSLVGEPHRGRFALSGDTTFAALGALRTVLSFGLGFRGERRASKPEEDLLRLLVEEDVAQTLTALTRGPIRFRLASSWPKASVWAFAREVSERAPGLVCDPNESPWTFEVDGDARTLRLRVVPRGLPDDRFLYRESDVPGASHPTIAAALARALQVRAGDRIWDPFVGGALELCEASRLADDLELFGTDRDPAALKKAERNLRAAGASRFDLRAMDARDFNAAGLTAIVTNAPMGRRVGEGVDLGRLVRDTLKRGASLLSPGGRIVLLSPSPEASRLLTTEGFSLEIERPVDMGGFDAVLQRFVKSKG